ncbi:MAG: family 10 glycosylhydrolase [Planctomycetota bacterium]
MNLICLLAATLLTAGIASADHHEEVRGTWMTTTANTAIASPENTAASMARLKELGLNTVYVECWKNGYTEWPSPTMKALVGVEMKINNAPAELQRDLLAETIREAHANDLKFIAWLEYGFMAAFKDTDNELRRVAGEKGWLTETKDGELVGEQNPFVWMNPLHPGPQQLLIDLTLEVLDNYDVDGVQLDDRIAMPVEMGYDDYTKQLYASEHDGAMPPDDPRDPAWVQWRADKVTEYAKRYAATIRAKHPDVIISVSPAPWPWSLDNYACDWPKWTHWETDDGKPLWDEFLPQCYRMDGPATIRSVDEQIDAMTRVGDGDLSTLIPGIRLVGEGPDMPDEDLVKVIEHIRANDLGGHVHWFSRGVLEVMPDTVHRINEE